MEQESGSEMVNFNLTKDKLNGVGCGFCLAKWTQVTMHLHNGTTHSCHHPEPHKVSLEELSRNPTALHNSKIKKLARKEMLENKQRKERVSQKVEKPSIKSEEMLKNKQRNKT